jgi:TP901 family phage tail tape measure protein
MMAGVGGGLYMFSNMVRSGIREAAAFEKQMANVSTMLDDQSMSILPRYTERLRFMSREFGEGTETLAKGLYDILSASIDTAKALDVLTVSTKAAKAGVTDTGVAADAITTILNSYSLEAERAGDVSDKLFTIVKLGKTTFGELAPNIGKIAAIAATVGASFDDLGATLATMTRAGVQTEIAITSLRAILLGFIKPGPEAAKLAMDEFGLALNSATIRSIGLVGVIQKLKTATAEQLAIILPSSRAITGFAAAVQKATALAGDYDTMLNSLGATEEAYQKIAATSAFQLEQSKQQWTDIKRSVGDAILPSLAAALDSMSKSLERNRGAIKRWGEDTAEGFGMAKRAMDAYWNSWMMIVPRTITGFVMPASLPESPAQGETWADTIKRFEETGLLLAASTEIKAPPGNVATGAAGKTDEVMKAELDAVKEKIASVRALEYLTRQERMTALKEYQTLHGYTMDGITEQEMALSAEITSIHKSRLDAMKVYHSELKEDMQDTSLYISEKFADVAQEIEGSMSSAFQSMIQGGANFRDAMNQFFMDIGASFAKMASDMAARAMMSGIMNAVVGGLFAGAAGSEGNPFVAPEGSFGAPTQHAGWVPHGTPSFRRGRGLKSNEMAAIIEKDEMLVPSKQIVKGGATNFEPKFNIIIVRDEKAAQIEAMNSKEGEKSYIRHASRNRNI